MNRSILDVLEEVRASMRCSDAGFSEKVTIELSPDDLMAILTWLVVMLPSDCLPPDMPRTYGIENAFCIPKDGEKGGRK